MQGIADGQMQQLRGDYDPGLLWFINTCREEGIADGQVQQLREVAHPVRQVRHLRGR